MNASAKGEDGFTLIELIVALAIFALIAVAGVSLLNSVIGVEDRTRGRLDRLGELQRAMHLVTRDLQQALPETVDLREDGLYFRRQAENTLDPTPLVTYRHADNTLQRLLDGGPPGGQRQTLIGSVSSVSWSFFFPGSGWRSDLQAPVPAAPGQGQSPEAPAAIAVDILLDPDVPPPTGSLRRVVELADGSRPGAAP